MPPEPGGTTSRYRESLTEDPDAIHVPAAAIVEERSLGLAGADELESIVERALEANPKAVEEFKAGKGKALGAIVGFVMRETKGRADGGEVNRLIREKLGV